MAASCAENHAGNVTSFPPKVTPAEIGTKIKTRWVTNNATEFFNSLCPNNQYSFPTFDWCNAGEMKILRDACESAFHTIKEAWGVGGFEREKLTSSERRILLVVERKTFRFGKLLEKIPRRTFIRGDGAEDRYGFEIVPVSGLTNSNLTRGLASLRRARSIGCVKADRHNGNDASNIYCVQPVRDMLSQFIAYVTDVLEEMVSKGRVSVLRWTELAEGLKRELHVRLMGIIIEDEGYAS